MDKARILEEVCIPPSSPTFVLPRDALEFWKNFGVTEKSKCTFIIKPDGECQGRTIYQTKSLSEMDQASIYVD